MWAGHPVARWISEVVSQKFCKFPSHRADEADRLSVSE
jgi:hypothetical protein